MSSWYENQDVIGICTAVKNELNCTKSSFVSLGYWLKQVRDRRLYEETGHSRGCDPRHCDKYEKGPRIKKRGVFSDC